MEKNYKINTKCVQSGWEPKNGEPRVLPIYQSTTYKYDDSDYLGDLFDLKADGHMYSRISNPTAACVEKKIAELEALTVTDEELETEYTNISNAYNIPLEEVKKMINADDLKADVLVGHAMKFVRDNAKVGKAKKATTKKAAKAETAEAPAEEKKPARKPRAKKTTTESAE